jgi:hypothetical protein
MAFKQRISPPAYEVQNSVNSAYIITMTLVESLQRQLRYAVEKYGENAPVSLEIKEQLSEIESERRSSEQRPIGPTEVLSFHVGFRKANPQAGA